MKDWLIGFLIFIIFMQWLAIGGLQGKVKDLKNKYKEVESMLKNYNAAKSDLHKLTEKFMED